jgi:hypothetical protein
MSTIVRLLIPPKQAEATQKTQYVVPDLSKVVIDKFTATNTSNNNAIISINLIPFNETASNSNAITYSRSIAPKETYTFPELIGQVITSKGYISTIASVANSLTITASGREIN